MYLPVCNVSMCDNILFDIFSSITNDLINYNEPKIICGGDLNWDFKSNNLIPVALGEFMKSYKLKCCDSFLDTSKVVTYQHVSLKNSSHIDHFLVSENVFDDVASSYVLDEGQNLSDHLPVCIELVRDICHCKCPNVTLNLPHANNKARLSWDKADKSSYYYDTYISLLNCESLFKDNVYVTVPSENYGIEQMYSSITTCLINAANKNVPKTKSNFYKFWWDSELSLLKPVY